MILSIEKKTYVPYNKNEHETLGENKPNHFIWRILYNIF